MPPGSMAGSHRWLTVPIVLAFCLLPGWGVSPFPDLLPRDLNTLGRVVSPVIRGKATGRVGRRPCCPQLLQQAEWPGQAGAPCSLSSKSPVTQIRDQGSPHLSTLHMNIVSPGGLHQIKPIQNTCRTLPYLLPPRCSPAHFRIAPPTLT